MLWIPGHLHIFYNGLKGTLLANPSYNDFLDRLQVITTFTNSGDLRRRFQHVCLAGQPVLERLFATGARIHISWKWEFLTAALEYVIPRVLPLSQNLNINAMLASDRGSPLKDKAARDMQVALRDAKGFVATAEMSRIFCKVIDKFVGILEGCPCHRDIWTANISHESKLKKLFQQTGYRHCVWKGRNGTYWQTRGRREFTLNCRVR